MDKIDLQDFFADKPSVKYCCAKQAIAISKEDPGKLYPDFDFFVQFLDGKGNVMRWTATLIIGNLASVDKNNKVEKVIPIFTSMLTDKSMITASNAIKALGQIAMAKPKHRDEILKALFKVEKAEYYSKGKLSPECRNVVIGHVIDSLVDFGEDVYERQDVRRFLKRQTKNTREKVKKKAEKLLSSLGKSRN